jgi:hypothetical protein
VVVVGPAPIFCAPDMCGSRSMAGDRNAGYERLRGLLVAANIGRPVRAAVWRSSFGVTRGDAAIGGSSERNGR